jgi:hypothetical protein
MNRHHRRPVLHGIVATLTGALTLLVLGTIAPMSAQAAACTQTITGAHSGVLNVAANQKLCLDGAVQNGAVNVAPNGALSVLNKSTITGAVTLKSGFETLEFCGSKTVRGAISATGGKGAVLIGSVSQTGAQSCAANTIGGAVTLNANKAGVKLARNTISGKVTASANLKGTVISGNHIGGALNCSANNPAPTNGGVKNSVSGGRSGQTCATTAF